MENDMSKKYEKDFKEKPIPGHVLTAGLFDLVDEKKCLYKTVPDDGNYYRIKNSIAFQVQNVRAESE